MRHYILCDIDHVISDAFRRDYMISAVDSSWDDYHTAAADDEPIDDMVRAINAFATNGFLVVGFTARPRKWYNMTMKWMTRNGVMIDELLMRPDENYRPAPEVKIELALERFGGEAGLRENVMLVLDDREDVAAAFNGLGVTSLQVYARRSETDDTNAGNAGESGSGQGNALADRERPEHAANEN